MVVLQWCERDKEDKVWRQAARLFGSDNQVLFINPDTLPISYKGVVGIRHNGHCNQIVTLSGELIVGHWPVSARVSLYLVSF